MKQCIGREFSLLQRTVNKIVTGVFAVSLGLYITVANATPPDHLAQAKASAKKGNQYHAMVNYHRALRDAPGDAEVLMGLANSYYRLGRLDKALEYVQQIPVSDQSHRYRALMLKGRIASRNQNWRQAKQHYKQALAKQKTGPAYIGLAQALSRLGDTKGSEAAYADHQRLQGKGN